MDRSLAAARTDATARPWPITWIVRSLVALIALHLAVPAILILQRTAVADGIRRANPAMGAREVAYSLAAALIAGTLFHLLFVGLYTLLAAKLRSGRRWTRVVLSATLVVATVASVVSFTSSPLFRLVIPATDLLQLALIGFLWVPESARTHFARTGGSR